MRFHLGPDGNATSLWQYCGQALPDPFVVPTQDVFVNFQSDGSQTFSGFRLRYEAIPDPGRIVLDFIFYCIPSLDSQNRKSYL